MPIGISLTKTDRDSLLAGSTDYVNATTLAYKNALHAECSCLSCAYTFISNPLSVQMHVESRYTACLCSADYDVMQV